MIIIPIPTGVRVSNSKRTRRYGATNSHSTSTRPFPATCCEHSKVYNVHAVLVCLRSIAGLSFPGARSPLDRRSPLGTHRGRKQGAVGSPARTAAGYRLLQWLVGEIKCQVVETTDIPPLGAVEPSPCIPRTNEVRQPPLRELVGGACIRWTNTVFPRTGCRSFTPLLSVFAREGCMISGPLFPDGHYFSTPRLSFQARSARATKSTNSRGSSRWAHQAQRHPRSSCPPCAFSFRRCGLRAFESGDFA